MNCFKKLSTSLCFVLILFSAAAQNRLDDKSQKKYDKIKTLIKEKKTEKAIEEMDKFIEDHPEYIKAYLTLGNIYTEEKNWEKALENYNTVLDIKPDYKDMRLYYTIAFAKRQLNDFDGAIAFMDEVLHRIDPSDPIYAKMVKEKKQIQFIQSAMKNPLDITPQRLPDTINTTHSEYLPSYRVDGSKMIFTRRIGDNEDLYECEMSGDSVTNIYPLDQLNTEANEGAHALSPDGNLLIYTACEVQDSKGGCDLYISMLRNGEWSKPFNLGDKFNTRFWDAQPSLSRDGRTVYFSSKRPDGQGQKDIWVIKFDPKTNKFGRAKNLGASINTTGNESSPFIHPDGKTLYFRSDFHPGFGDYDLFVTRMQADGSWSEPQNLGYPINTELSEGALFVSLEGKKAYYASDVDSDPPNLNIFSFELPEDLRPTPTTFLKAKVVDAVSKLPLNANLELINLATNEKFVHNTNEEGIALTAVPANSKYAVNIQSKGYIFYSKHIDITESHHALEPFLLQVELEKMQIIAEATPSTPVEKESKAIVLENIFFATGSDQLLPGSDIEITKLENILKENSGIKIKIIGHTDNVGDTAANQQLSEKRAKAVYTALSKRQIPTTRLVYEGMGESSPIDTNETEAGKQRNRRTEFVIIYE